MTREQFDKVKRGDILRHVNEAESYVVETRQVSWCSHNEGQVTLILVRTAEATNPEEWVKIEQGHG